MMASLTLHMIHATMMVLITEFTQAGTPFSYPANYRGTVITHPNGHIASSSEQELIKKAEIQIEKYLNEVKRTLEIDFQHTVHKRSPDLTMSRINGVDIFKGFEGIENFTVPAKFPNDIIYFSKCTENEGSVWYAATLEADRIDPQYSYANKLVLYKHVGEKFIELYEMEVKGGIRLAIHEIQGNVYVVVAEHEAGALGRPLEGSNVYILNNVTDKLDFVQTLNTKFPSDVVIWENHHMHEVFAAVTMAQDNSTGSIQYNTQSYIWHWQGSHFDTVDMISTYNPRSIVHFSVGNNMYIAFANHKNDYNETDIDSEIFRYNLHSGKFSLYQKLRTHAALDIKYFCFESNEKTEGFLVVANNYVKDENGNINYNTNSIIYKLSDEEYFIPFQSITLYGASQWLPVMDNSNNNRGFVLLAATMEGIVSFQYDGWRFVTTSISYTLSTFGPGVSTMRRFLYGNQTVFTISNKKTDGSNINVFKASFTYDPSLEKFFDNMETWCKNTLQEVNETKLEELLKTVQEAPSNNMTEVNLNSSIQFTDVSVDTLITNSSEYIMQIRNQLDTLSRELDEAEKLFDQYNKFPTVYVPGDVHLSNAEISCLNEGCDFNSLNVTNLNGENFLEFMENAVKVNDEINYNGQLEFENLAIQGELDVEVVNDHPFYYLVDWSQNNNFTLGLEVKGNVTLKSGMKIGGNIDGVTIEKDKVLLSSEDQYLSGELIFEEATVDQLTVRKTLNGWNVNAITDPDYYILSSDKSIDSLNVSQLLLDDGLISGIDFGNLNVSALKLNGDQIVTAYHKYENIKADTVMIEGTLSGIRLNKEIVPVSSGDVYEFPGELIFEVPFEYYVLSRHSNVSEFPTMATGVPAQYRDDYNPAGRAQASSQPSDQTEIYDNEPIVLRGNIFINGSVTVYNGHLVTKDLMNTEKNVSLKEILHSGLLLNETNINNPMHFSVPFKVNTLNVTTINGVKPESFVLINETGVVTISGHKIFKDCLHLNNTYTITAFVNDVNISQLLSDTLRKTGDQIITGDKNISSISAKKLKSDETYFGNVSWNDILKLSENQNFSGGIGTFNSFVVTENVNIDNLTINGTVSGFKINELLEDNAYTDDQVYNVNGFKNFTGIVKIKHLSAPSVSGLETSKLLSLAVNNSANVTWTTSVLQLPRSIRVKNLNFTGNLDGIEARDFGKWLLTEGDQTIIGEQIFRQNVNAIGGISVMKDGTINDINVDDIILNTRRIDRKEEFTKEVTFENNVISSGDIIIKGTVQGIDLSKEALLSDSTETQQIVGHKTFYKDIIVTGSILHIGSVSGINVSALCQAIVSNSSHLHITGSAKLLNEPKVTGTFNNISLDTLLKNVWLRNENVTVNGTVEFTDVLFLKNLSIKGSVNDISIDNLVSKYISLSKDQTITGNTYFSGGIIVDADLVGSSVTVGKNVSGLNLEHFASNVMLDGEDQTVSAEWDFVSLCTTGVLNSTGYVNNLNLSSEVMRTDVPVNYMTGRTQIMSVNTEHVTIPAGTKIHGVDITEWNSTAVKKTSDFVVTGNKTFNGIFNASSSINVNGMVNDIWLDKDHVMLLSEEQIISGRHIYDEGSYVYITDLGISGSINDVNMTELFQRQAYTNGNITIKSHMNFTKPLHGTNVHLPGIYGGYNLTNISTILDTPLPKEAFEDELRVLRQVADTAQKSLAAAGYYLKNYIQRNDISMNFLGVVPLKSTTSEILLAVSEPKSINRSQFTLYEWKSDTGMFVMKTGSKNVSLLTTPTSYQSIVTEDGQFLMYIESGYVNSSNVELGEVLQLVDNSIMHLEGFPVTMHSSVITFTDYYKQQSYYLVVEKQGQYCHVYHYSFKKRKLYRRKSLLCHNATQVTSASTEENVYIVVSRTGNQSGLDVWKFAKRTSRFQLFNTVSVHNPVSVSMITYSKKHYIAVANKHVVGNARPESVDIYRFDSETGDLYLFQSIPVTSPLNIKFCHLPTDELVLYVMTENPATPFIVYNYRGLAGFKEWLTASTLPLIKDFVPITDNSNDKHLVIMTNHDKVMVFEAIFKGKKIYN